MYSVAKRRQRLWQTISLLIITTNGNIKRHTVWIYFFILASSRVISGIISPFRVLLYASRRCPVCPVGAYFPDKDRCSIHYPLHRCLHVILYNLDIELQVCRRSSRSVLDYLIEHGLKLCARPNCVMTKQLRLWDYVIASLALMWSSGHTGQKGTSKSIP